MPRYGHSKIRGRPKMPKFEMPITSPLVRFRNILTRENQAITPQSAPKFDEEFDFGHKNSLSNRFPDPTSP